MWQGNTQGATNKRSVSLGNETAGQRLSPRPWRQMTEALRSQRRARQELYRFAPSGSPDPKGDNDAIIKGGEFMHAP